MGIEVGIGLGVRPAAAGENPQAVRAGSRRTDRLRKGSSRERAFRRRPPAGAAAKLIAAERFFPGTTKAWKFPGSQPSRVPRDPDTNMDRWLQDLRYSMRRLARQPGFTLTALLTLGLGIGANVALFSIINAVLLRPTPGVREQEQLVRIYTSDYSGPTFGTSAYPDYQDIARADDVFEGVAAVAQAVTAVGDPTAPTRVGVELVTAEYFGVLGVTLRGRGFTEEEAERGLPLVVVSDAFWRSALGASADALGREILINGRPVTVIGITPPGFRGMQRAFAGDVWLPLFAGGPLRLAEEQAALIHRGNRGLGLVARLRPGVSSTLAQQRLRAIASQLHAAYPDHWTDVRGEPRRLTLISERAGRVPPQMRGAALGFGGVLSATAGIVLLICCANLAGLMLARVASRSREVAIRLSIGSTRNGVRTLLLTESLLLASGGAVLGFMLSVWSLDLATRLMPGGIPVALELGADTRVLLFTAAAALMSAVLFGMAPALRGSRTDLAGVLKGESTSARWRGRRLPLRSLLVSGQVAASLVLLVGAALFLRSLRAASSLDLGYNTRDVLLVPLEPAPGSDVGGPERTRVAHDVANRIAAVPGIESATWANNPLIGPGSHNRRGTTIEGYTPGQGEDMEFHYNMVGPRYFQTLGLALIRGREFTEQDRDGAPGVVVVNETFARRFWPGQDPLGKRISVTGPEGEYLTVVGIARDVRLVDVASDSRAFMFLPALQHPGGTLLHVRATGQPTRQLDALRAIVAETAPGWTAQNPRTLETQVATSILPQRLAGYLLSGFGVLALVLACVGLYGVVAYAIAQGTRELGIRYALGASPTMMLRVTVGHALRLVGGGLLVGLLLSVAAGRVIRSLLLGTSPLDAASFVAAPIVLVLVAMMAVYVPARRVLRMDPLSALRAE